jgi:Rap1a immunity proteins
LMQAPHRVLGRLVSAGTLATLLPAMVTNRDGRWLRQLCTSTEPADVSVCDAYILGIFDSLARWGPLPKCVPAGVTDKQAESIVITYLNSDSKDLLLPADLLVTKAISDAFRCRS